LVDRLKLESDVANLKITALASKLDNSPEALAIAVWNPLKQEGILKVEKLPALDAGKDYQLWIVDPQYKDPVDGGVFTVDPVTGEARISFKSKQPVKSIGAFAVTLERKGGVPKAEGPFVLLGTK
jgi:anti-sigma-K factor RskA